MIFTTPFFNRDNNVIRARIENGELVHLEPPAYHGNPMCPDKGSLVFTDHGWQMIEDLRSAGFSSVETGLCYDPFQGIVSDNHPCPEFHTWPLIFRARR